MINALGGIRQLAMVVRDADEVMRHFAETLGVGPFYVMRNIKPGDYFYRGQPALAPELTLGFAQAGAVQIEIIQQHNDAPSGYLDFLSRGLEGCQHIATWFADPAEYDAARRRMLDAGLTLVHENGAAAVGLRFAYFETALPGSLMLEISEALSPTIKPLTDLVTSSAATWDGTEPIRNIG